MKHHEAIQYLGNPWVFDMCQAPCQGNSYTFSYKVTSKRKQGTPESAFWEGAAASEGSPGPSQSQSQSESFEGTGRSAEWWPQPQKKK